MTTPSPQLPTLSVVIPALNEEAAIGDTIRRCLEARAGICADAGLAGVEILVVNDGSTDKTEAIARAFREITVLSFPHNRGYGAAIQHGFAHARGELLGFLDADGTCDPRLFGALGAAIRDGADLALGSRMGPDSQMPLVRAVGNTMFAWILGLLAKSTVRDTASGMRVLRRSALAGLYPLPTGLHFTPAMSARALIERKLRLVEVPMPYAERVGRSKLSVVRDGVRFLQVIVRAAMCYRPARPLLLLAGIVALGGFLLGLGPVWFYLRNLRLEEGMIYQILVSSLLFTWVALLLCAAVIADRIAASAHDRPPVATGITGLLTRLLAARPRRVLAVVLVAAVLALSWPLFAGGKDMHWSRVVLASLLLVGLAVLWVTAFMLEMMDLIQAQRGQSKPPEP